jgi:hypothetical protein
MADWGGERVSYSAQGLAPDNPPGNGTAVVEDRIVVRRKMREFIRNFRQGAIFPYRDQVVGAGSKRERGALANNEGARKNKG